MRGGDVCAAAPVWAQLREVKRLTGVPRNIVRRLAEEGLVRARKLDPAPHGTVVVGCRT